MPIGWNEAEPSDSSAANLGATELRSLKTTLATALANAMYWPGSGGASAASAGLPLPGKWRAFFGPQSAVSAYADGALYVTSDTSRLFGVGSGGTMFLGSAQALEQAAVPGGNARWVLSSGTAVASSAFSYGSVSSGALQSPLTYNGLPVVTYSLTSSSVTVLVGVITSLGLGGATIAAYNLAGSPSVSTVYWQSLGTVTF